MPREAEAVASRTKPSRYDRRAKGARPSRATSGVAKEAYPTYIGLVTGEIKKRKKTKKKGHKFESPYAFVLTF